jgi:hypothetical protein
LDKEGVAALRRLTSKTTAHHEDTKARRRAEGKLSSSPVLRGWEEKRSSAGSVDWQDLLLKQLPRWQTDTPLRPKPDCAAFTFVVLAFLRVFVPSW